MCLIFWKTKVLLKFIFIRSIVFNFRIIFTILYFLWKRLLRKGKNLLRDICFSLVRTKKIISFLHLQAMCTLDLGYFIHMKISRMSKEDLIPTACLRGTFNINHSTHFEGSKEVVHKIFFKKRDELIVKF